MKDYFIADDLSGALEAGAAFQRTGRRVRIVFQPEALAAAGPEELVGITTETRNAPPDVAAEAVTAAMAAGRAAGRTLVFKKIDSTLRGPVAAEVAALLELMPGANVLFVPANPAAGRVVRAGLLLVDGVPLADSEFGRDPVSPCRESSVRRVLGASAVGAVSIPDIETDDDLRHAVDEMRRRHARLVPIGSGALARAVAEAIRPIRVARVPLPALPKGPVLLVSGSAHLRNRAQGKRLLEAHGVPTLEIELTNPATVCASAIAALRQQGAAALLPSTARVAPSTAQRAVLAVVSEVLAHVDVRRLFVTGGETACALCRAFDIGSLEILGEIEPGLTLSFGHGRQGATLIAVKPGGFGSPDAWVHAFESLRDR